MPICKETIQYRKNNNLCPRCGQPNAERKSLCQKHLDQFAAKTLKYRTQKKENGLCPECGGPNITNGYCCLLCKEKVRQRVYKSYKKRYDHRSTNKFCINCGEKAIDNLTLCSTCQEKINKKNKNKYYDRLNNNLCVVCGKKEIISGNSNRCEECKLKRNKWYQGSTTQQKDFVRRQERVDIVLNHYGNICRCCGENKKEFLTIDHINNDGGSHRKKINKAGSTFYKWLIDNNFPQDYQTLCMNCQFGKLKNNGICPHQQSNNKILESEKQNDATTGIMSIEPLT